MDSKDPSASRDVRGRKPESGVELGRPKDMARPSGVLTTVPNAQLFFTLLPLN